MPKAPFTILNRLADSSRPYQLSADDLSELASELEAYGGYQIQARKRGRRSWRLELIVTYEGTNS
jgi:hypothetical protein